jgi:hypothetical protein
VKIQLTSSWDGAMIAAVWQDILRCLNLYVQRFPDDETLESLIAQITSGALQLWLIEDDGKIVMAVLTRIATIQATGKKQVQVLALGGERGEDVMPCLLDIEAWARSIGAQELEITGRHGWRKRLAKQGWGSVAEIYRKSLKG